MLSEYVVFRLNKTNVAGMRSPFSVAPGPFDVPADHNVYGTVPFAFTNFNTQTTTDLKSVREESD